MSEDYKWADGTALDYTAWGAGQPTGDPVRKGIPTLILSVIQFLANKCVRDWRLWGGTLAPTRDPRAFNYPRASNSSVLFGWIM